MKTILMILMTYTLSNNILAKTQFTIVNTGHADSYDFLARECGDFVKRKFNHAAFVFKHKGKTFAFDTGIGANIENEFSESMPFWAKPFFGFESGSSLKQQLPNQSYDYIFLSHAHWDHTGGLTDKLDGPLYLPEEELKEISNEHRVDYRTFPIHLKDVRPKVFKWTNKKFLNFEKHYDPFGDKKFVFVHLPGHSFGSIGLLVTIDEHKLFFVGDAVWTVKQLDDIDHKFFLASKIVDRDKEVLKESMKKIKYIQDSLGYQIIPTHDAEAHDKLGYFPKWLELN